MAEVVDDQKKEEISDVPLDEKANTEDKFKKVDTEEEKETPKNGEETLASESSEEELGSLEKPIEILTKKRDRKSVERLSLNNADLKKAPENDLDYSKGKGMKLGDIQYVKYMIDKTRPEDLKTLHKLLYFKPGKNTTLKKEIRTFCGYPFEESSELSTRISSMMERVSIPELKFISGVLSLEKGGDKGKLKEKLLEFLMKPVDTGKTIPGTKKTKSKKKSTDLKDTKVSSAPSKKAKEEKDNTKSDAIKSESEEDTEKDSPKKKKKKSKAMSVKLPAPKTKTPSKKKEVPKRTADDNSENEDMPLLKKTKKEPSDSEIKKVVKDLLKDVNLEEVTMKTVCKQVYDHFPDFDLTSRKDFIKSTVKETIS
ncbi:protein DEK isoform X2 [Hydra vulgaris]|uniref:Protein DEK isoform X2 n=1 Tax=Hydra vulgaris TaxID=6087 RepID=A0ABM4D5J0_HYDVU